MKLCLIGSTRFISDYHELNRKLSLAGHIVYAVALVSSAERGTQAPNITADEKETLDLVHLRKIQESDGVVLVTDEAGYVGESTKRELKWAAMVEKYVFRPGDNVHSVVAPGVRSVIPIGTYKPG